MSKLTSEEYVARKGIVCPVCQSDDVEITECAQFDGDVCSQQCECEYCCSRWTDLYTLTGYTDLVNNKETNDE